MVEIWQSYMILYMKTQTFQHTYVPDITKYLEKIKLLKPETDNKKINLQIK